MKLKWVYNPFSGNLGSFDAVLAVNFEETSPVEHDVWQFDGVKWVNQQDVKLLGTGEVILKEGNRIIFDGG